MSIFYYFVSQKPLPNSTIERANSNHYFIDDVTQFVKDAKKNHYYYNCNPAAVYLAEDEFDISNDEFEIIYSKLIENNLLLIMAYEFLNLGNFQFIKMWEDNTRCDTGYFEAFFQKCRHEDMSFRDYCKALENGEEGIETDIYYTIKVDEERI